MNIESGKTNRGCKVVIYGPEGVGKTILASKFPSSLFIDTEGSTDRYETIKRITPVKGQPFDWEFITATVIELIKEPPKFETLVIDSADWTEIYCTKYVCKSNNKKGIEEFGFGKGYVYLSETYQALLNALDILVKKGINVVFTAHAKMVKIELPDQDGSYDRWQLKLSKQVAPLLKEWADMILFCNYETEVVVVDEKSKKAKGKDTNKRVMYTTHHACWDAKNRDGLAPKLDLDYECISHLFEKGGTKKKTKSKAKVEEEVLDIEEPTVEPDDFINVPEPEPVAEPEAEIDDDFDLFAEPEADYPDNLVQVVKEMFSKCTDEGIRSEATQFIKKFGSYSQVDEAGLKKLYDMFK